MFAYLMPLLLSATLVLLVQTSDSESEAKEFNLYCENVEMWVESKMDNGHPNYKNLDCATE